MTMGTTEEAILYPDVGILCRVCLKIEESMTSLKDNIYSKRDGKDMPVAEFLRRLLGVRMYQYGGYPSRLCRSCLNSLLIGYEFKMLYENTNELLRDLIGDCDESAVNGGQIKSSSDSPSVDVVINGLKFNLNDLVIVESDDGDEEAEDSRGVLNKLGPDVSAECVNKNSCSLPESGSEEEIVIEEQDNGSFVEGNCTDDGGKRGKLIETERVSRTISGSLTAVNVIRKNKTFYKKRIKPCICSVCHLGFISLSALIRHKRTYHRKTKTIKQSSAAHDEDNKFTIVEYEPYRGPSVVCSFCLKTFIDEALLEYHLRNSHDYNNIELA